MRKIVGLTQHRDVASNSRMMRVAGGSLYIWSRSVTSEGIPCAKAFSCERCTCFSKARFQGQIQMTRKHNHRFPKRPRNVHPKVGFKQDGINNCDENKTVVNTSLKSVQTSHDVNLRITQAFSHIGKGYSAIEKFCMVMNIDPFSSTTYGKCVRRLDNAYTLASENLFVEIHPEIKNVYENGAEITDFSISFDGTWLTRGHTSLIGVGCVIDMLTGYVVDFEVMSKVCRHCSVAKNKLGQSSAEFSIWYEGHKSECDINHLGSSTSMEMEAALTLWKRSTSLGFRYITVLSDGDCKTFNYLCEKKVYGPDIVIKKEECINHVSKRLGTALRSTVKDCRAQGISLGGKAHGSLKEATIKN
ncbi:uncharacterized protein TNCV_2010671 [Trichonephila clavipes]|nr:uncharacterized protein TNCV_2010671 [Trichonephila clavipes]